MGKDKALLDFNGEPLIQRVIRRLSPIANEIFIVSNHPAQFHPFGLSVYSDEIPGVGALGGLYTALSRAHDGLVANSACDMPFANPKLLAWMAQAMIDDESIDAVVPKTGGYFEPTFAVYRRSTCLPWIHQAILHGDRRLISWFDQAKIETVTAATLDELDPRQRAFINVNTPEEFAEAQRLDLISE